MLRISRETDYAVRVLLALARHAPGERVLTREVREEMLIPKHIVGRVVARLAKGGFIESLRGRGGGIRLARPPQEINLREVVTFFERSFSISDCLESPEICPFTSACPVRRRWARLQNLVLRELESITFADLAAESLSAPVATGFLGFGG